jgi:hypothetical protein
VVVGMKQNVPFFMYESLCCSVCANVYVDVSVCVYMLIDAEVIMCEVACVYVFHLWNAKVEAPVLEMMVQEENRVLIELIMPFFNCIYYILLD